MATPGSNAAAVTIYEHANFQGRSRTLAVGQHRLNGPGGVNDMASSIRVPQGFVGMVYESADSGGGYGRTADFLEDCPDLSPLGLNDMVSFVTVFRSPSSTGLIWRRNSMVNGKFMAGHWAHRLAKGEASVNPTVVVSPPYPPHDRCAVQVEAVGPRADEVPGLWVAVLDGPGDRRVHHSTAPFGPGRSATFSGLPAGTFWVRADTRADVPWGPNPAVVEVRCRDGRTERVTIAFG